MVAKGALGKLVGLQHEGHAVAVARGQRRGDVAGQDRHHAHARAAALAAQAFAIGDHRRLAGAVGAVARQAADRRDAGDADQRARAARTHGGQKRMEGGCGADVVEREHVAHHVQVLAHCRVHADADAGVGDHHIGQALPGDAALGSADDAVDLLHVGGVGDAALGTEALRLGPVFDFCGAASGQRQSPSRLCVACCQRLADAARRAGDEGQRGGHLRPAPGRPKRPELPSGGREQRELGAVISLPGRRTWRAAVRRTSQSARDDRIRARPRAARCCPGAAAPAGAT